MESNSVLRARDWQDGQFKVKTTSSPIDQMREPEFVYYDAAMLARPLHNFKIKRPRLCELISLGEPMDHDVFGICSR